ncbi:hypothetical protein GmHk_20G057166 [Glycine max]|nr:hypothetical protein GmHk_20G057166 [Glycine max]
MLTQGFRKFYGSIMEAPETIFQQRGGACCPVVSDAILPRKGPITRTMSKRLQEDWARAAEEGPRVLMNLKRTKFRALLSLSFHSSPSSSKLLSMASYGGELLLDSSSP